MNKLCPSVDQGFLAALLLLVVAAGCGDDSGGQIADAALPDAALPFALTTSAFDQGATIPLRYECGGVLQGPGENISPALAWTSGPAGTMSYAITMIDVDTSVIHWAIYDIPATVRDLAENMPAGYEPVVPAGARQAELQGSGYYGYFGPCSPASVNTYEWTLHAIPTVNLVGVTQSSTEQASVSAIQAASIASVSFSGES